MGAGEEPFDGFLIRGKFNDSSNSDNWHCLIDGVEVDLRPYTNFDTKEFEYWQKEKPKSLERMFERDSSAYRNLEAIYEIRGTENCTNMGRMFEDNRCMTFIDLSGLDTSKVKNMIFMFYYTFYSAGSINSNELILDWNLNNVTPSDIFTGCYMLAKISGKVRNIKRSISINPCPLTAESAQVFIDGLSPEGAGQTITFSATTKELLSEEQKQQIANKGWILA